jgi:nitrogen regulatory protein P-II 1
MKKVEAIIRKTKFEEVKGALNAVGIEFFSFWEVRGVGQAREERLYRGVIYDTSSIERIKLSIIVRDKNLQKTIKAILNAASTGEIGDGKIFVIPIEQSYRIRTGESGDDSLYIKGLEE